MLWHLMPHCRYGTALMHVFVRRYKKKKEATVWASELGQGWCILCNVHKRAGNSFGTLMNLSSRWFPFFKFAFAPVPAAASRANSFPPLPRALKDEPSIAYRSCGISAWAAHDMCFYR